MKKSTGEKIISLRELKNISRKELAEKADMTEEMVETIENGEVLPSLSPIIKIARAMGVRLGTFLDDTQVQGPVVTKEADRTKSRSFSSKTSASNTYMDFMSLARDKAGRHMEPFLMSIKPVHEDEYIFSSHEGEEFIYVLEGEIEISYGKENFVLSAGDSIYYDSIVKHNVHCTSKEPAKIIAVVYSPF